MKKGMLFSDIKKVAKDPRILVPVVVFAIFIFSIKLLIQLKNPLLRPSIITKVSICNNSKGNNNVFRDIEMDEYTQLYQCLENATRLTHGPTGKALATLLIHKKNGKSIRIKFFDAGTIQIDNRLYECSTDAKSNKLYSLLGYIANSEIDNLWLELETNS